MSTSIRSRSKINLGLAIGATRADGFHALTTLYQTLALHDVVTVKASRAAHTSIILTSTHPRVPVDAGNTAWRMAELVLTALSLRAEVHIHIDKRLPVQGGLGAGSANAAAALLGLERELEVEIPGPERLRLAAEIGSDVPLFLLGGTVLGTGRGEEVYPLPELPSIPCVLAFPEIGVSTPQAYRDWDKLHSRTEDPKAAARASGVVIASAVVIKDPISAQAALSLTEGAHSATIEGLSRSIAVAFGEPYSSGVFSERADLAESPLLALVRTGIENDFEHVVFPQYPFLGEIKRVLVGGTDAGDAAVYAALSGSGSALFGLYRTNDAAEAALARLRKLGVAGVITRTLPRDEFWREMRIL